MDTMTEFETVICILKELQHQVNEIDRDLEEIRDKIETIKPGRYAPSWMYPGNDA